MWGEIGVTARLLRERVGAVPAEDARPSIAERWAIWRDEKARRRRDDRGNGVSSASVFEALAADTNPTRARFIELRDAVSSTWTEVEAAVARAGG